VPEASKEGQGAARTIRACLSEQVQDSQLCAPHPRELSKTPCCRYSAFPRLLVCSPRGRAQATRLQVTCLPNPRQKHKG